ncbi:hypothetical protein SAMN04487786_1138 [Paenisporosarcina quisquiliarum]|nr:hypothetical protein SAMN04487786_1138 [Paenisporosarcina quisquiliarum]
MTIRAISIVAILILTAGILFYSLIYTNNGFWANGTILIGWVLFVYQYIMNYSERAYFATQKTFNYLKNPSNKWDFQFEFSSKNFSIDSFEKNLDILLGVRKNVSINNNRSLITLSSGIKIEVSTNISDSTVVFLIEDCFVPYRESKNIIDNSFHPIIELLYKKCEISNEKFSFNINFLNDNPYYGYFLKKVGPSQINNFQVNLMDDSSNVDIYNNWMMITSESFSDLSNVSKKYLTMSTTPFK